jgi:hypothetical protein
LMAGPAAYARTARDLARALLQGSRRPVAAISARHVSAFGAEVEEILTRCALDVVVSSRQPAWINHALRHPRRTVTGWILEQDVRACGFALLNVVRRDGARVGKVVECFLDDASPDLWHAAVAALTRELGGQGADVVEAFGSTPWTALALRENGFVPALQIDFLLHDPGDLLPRGAAFHLTPFEADYGYV